MKKGFTLAEALTTLMIIGIVAVISLPVLNNRVNESQFKAQARKTYTILSDAMAMVFLKGYVAEHNAVDSNTSNMKTWFENYLAPNLHVAKVCYDQKGCWHDGHTYGLDGKQLPHSKDGYIGANVVTALLNDGSTINIDAFSKSDIKNIFGVDIYTNQGIAVYFDVNGYKKPNILGKDIYAAIYLDDTLVPAWKDKTQAEIDSNCSKTYSGTYPAGYSCIQKVLLEDMQDVD